MKLLTPSFELLIFFFAIVLVWLGFVIFSLFGILKSKYISDINKLIWFLTVLFIPIFGTIFYWVYGRKQQY